MIVYALKYGLKLKGIKVNDHNDIKLNRHYPIIVTLDIEGSPHSVVLTSCKFGRLNILDPYLGMYSLGLKKFMKLWDGTALIIEDELSPTEEVNQFKFVEKKEKVVLSILQILAGVLCALGLYFFNQETQVASFVLLGLFFLFEVFSRWYAISICKQIDKRFASALNDKIIKNKELLYHYEEYKKTELSSSLLLVTNLIVSVFLIIITLLNSFTNSVFILVAVILAMVKASAIDPMMKKKSLKLAMEENNLSNLKNKDDYLTNFNEIHHESYKLACFNLLYKYGSYALMIVSVFIIMYLNKVASTSFLLFYSCLCIYLFGQLTGLFSVSEIQATKTKSKMILINELLSNSKR